MYSAADHKGEVSPPDTENNREESKGGREMKMRKKQKKIQHKTIENSISSISEMLSLKDIMLSDLPSVAV